MTLKAHLRVSACVLMASCVTPIEPPPVAPAIITGCTQTLQLPVCAPPGELPVFVEGDAADKVAAGYETLKGRIMQLDACLLKTRMAAEEFRRACNER